MLCCAGVAPIGRYIHFRRSGFFSFREVKAYSPNGKELSIVSGAHGFDGHPSYSETKIENCIDGKIPVSGYRYNICRATRKDVGTAGTWIRFDLGADVQIGTIEVFNRVDTNEQLSKFVRVAITTDANGVEVKWLTTIDDTIAAQESLTLTTMINDGRHRVACLNPPTTHARTLTRKKS